MLDAFGLPYVQRGLWEVLVLSVGAGILGTWIVARGLAFYSHGVAAATFPGLVLAAGVGFSPLLGAGVVAAVFALTVGRLALSSRSGNDTVTGMVLVGAMALGVILASDVFRSGGDIQNLLFGSLILVSGQEIVVAAVLTGTVVLATWQLGPRWLLAALEGRQARVLGVRSFLSDQVLLCLIAAAAVAMFSTLGVLLAAAVLVTPAATTRPWVRRMPEWRIATIALTAAQGAAGLWLSIQANVPPGAAIAVLSGASFALSATAHAGWRARRRLRGGRGLVALSVLGAVALLAGCGGSDDDAATTKAASGPLDVVATSTQLGDMVREVGGAAVDVHQILQPNTDPHDYEPRPADVSAAAKAKLVVESGNNLDKWMAQVVKQSGGTPTVLTIAPDHTPHRVAGEASGPEASKYDPHWWHDPRNAEAAVGAIRDALVTADPDDRATYEKHAAAYLQRVRTLDAGIARCFEQVPAADRKLVTSHDAFNYFAKRYDIDVVGAVIPSQTTQAQPSAGALSKLTALVRREHVKAIFPESSINPKLAEALARQTGARADLTLYGDTLGPKGSSGDTYLKMEQANANGMLEGFTGGRDHCVIPGALGAPR